jgi:hypothetical protein
MNGINWTHLSTLTLSPEKGSNELKTNGALNEALPMGIIVKGLLKAVIPALLASYIFNYYCNRSYPTISVTFQDTSKQFMYAVGVFAVLTLVQNIIFVPFMMSLYTNTLPSGLVRAVIFILNMCTYGWTAFTLLKLCIAEYNMSVRDTATTLVVSIVPLIVINYIIKNIF